MFVIVSTNLKYLILYIVYIYICMYIYIYIVGDRNIRDQGFVIGLNKSGAVKLRGLGQPPWKNIVNQL
jgi:hypothetical protein